MAMEQLWTLKQLSETWGVNYQTLWRWAQDGKLKTVRLPGRQLRVKESEIRRILEEEAVPA